MRQQEQRLKDINVEVAVVAFDADAMARDYVKRTGLPWPLLIDSKQRLYTAYGMTQGSWWTIYGPPTIWGYIKLILGGRMPGKPGKDWRQLGGDVLIDPKGIVRMHYVSDGPLDRPSIESLLAVVEKGIA